MHRTHRRRLIGGLAAGLCALTGLAVSTATVEASPGPTMDIQILSFNDFHGNLEPPAGSSGRIVVDHKLDANGKPVDVTQNVGGVEYLATHLAEAREGHPYSLTVAAGRAPDSARVEPSVKHRAGASTRSRPKRAASSSLRSGCAT